MSHVTKTNRIPIAGLQSGSYTVNTKLVDKGWDGTITLHVEGEGTDAELVLTFNIDFVEKFEKDVGQ
jgi:hypothetical protein